jgi:hypothetical protein
MSGSGHASLDEDDTGPLLGSNPSRRLELEIPSGSPTSHDDPAAEPDSPSQRLPWWHRRTPHTPRTPRGSLLSPIGDIPHEEEDFAWFRDNGRLGALREDDDARPDVSLGELYRSVPEPDLAEAHSWWRRCLYFSGPGSLIAVGYMDPGNWVSLFPCQQIDRCIVQRLSRPR